MVPWGLVPVEEGPDTMNMAHSEVDLEVAGNKSSVWGKGLAARNAARIGLKAEAALLNKMTPYCSTGDVHRESSARMTPGKDPAFRERVLSTSRRSCLLESL